MTIICLQRESLFNWRDGLHIEMFRLSATQSWYELWPQTVALWMLSSLSIFHSAFRHCVRRISCSKPYLQWRYHSLALSPISNASAMEIPQSCCLPHFQCINNGDTTDFHFSHGACSGRASVIIKVFCVSPFPWHKLSLKSSEVAFEGPILGLHPANERHRYKVTLSLIGWTQT